MGKITIEVSETIASKWEALKEERKNEINELVSKIISESESSKQVDYWERLREIRKRANEKGFTEDLLNQILNED
jgi:uncharacterized protein (UPF0297 family)